MTAQLFGTGSGTRGKTHVACGTRLRASCATALEGNFLIAVQM